MNNHFEYHTLEYQGGEGGGGGGGGKRGLHIYVHNYISGTYNYTYICLSL